MRSKLARADVSPEALLGLLVDVEHDLHRFGGVHRQRARRDMIQAAMAGGCSRHALAEVLGVTVGELRAWES